MPALGNFIVSYFPLFLFGAIFGYLMTVSGKAKDLAYGISALFGPKRVIFSVVIATALLTYGGVSAWVVAFTIVPIAIPLFQVADIPKRLMPAAIALGTITFALAALPGSPQIHNAIPTQYFGTTTFAAPLFGLLSALVMLAAGMAWLQYRARQLRNAGEGFDAYQKKHGIADRDDNDFDGDEQLPSDEPRAENNRASDGGRPSQERHVPGMTSGSGVAIDVQTEMKSPTQVMSKTPSRQVAVRGLLGLAPILIVIVLNFLFIYVLSSMMDTSYLAEEQYGSTSLDGVLGIWSVTFGLVAGILTIFLLDLKKTKTYVAGLSAGAKNAILPAMTTASEVGYGAVIASLAVFAVIRDGIFSLTDNAIGVSVMTTGLISGITGSSSGGLSITMGAFGDELAALAMEQGISAELMHRVTAMTSVSFDSLPHNGAILTMLLVCGMTHKASYKDIAVVTVVTPLAVLLGMLFLTTVLPIA